MKANYFLKTFVLLLFAITANAQQGINYKAIIKDGNGAAIVNTEITVQFTILENGTTSVYQETHNPTTDANGIVIVNIGEGTVESGIFNDIDWGGNPHFLNTKINKGEGLIDMGTVEFKTVPYALHAQSSSDKVTELNDLSDAKTTGYFSLFIGSNAGGSSTMGGQYSNAVWNYALSNSAIIKYSYGYQSLQHNTDGGFNTALEQVPYLRTLVVKKIQLLE